MSLSDLQMNNQHGPIQGVPGIHVQNQTMYGGGQKKLFEPYFVMPKVNRGGDRRRKVKIGLYFKLDLQENQLT